MARRKSRRQRNEVGRRVQASGSGGSSHVEPDVDHLEDIRELAAVRVEAEQLGAIAMHRARAAGHAWSAIGGAWGVSAQAAQQRHQRLLTMFPDLDARLERSGAL